MGSKNWNFHLCSCIQYHAAPCWAFCKPTKTVNQLHSTWSLYSKPTEAPLLRAEGLWGGGLWLWPNLTPRSYYKHTHTDMSWPTSLPACFYGCTCFSFATVTFLLWLMCALSSSSLHRAEAERISEENQCSSTSKFVSTSVAIHDRRQALHSQQHT